MFLGFILSVIYVPGWTGWAIQSGWLFLSAALPVLLWRKVPMTPVHWLGAAFLSYALASLFWMEYPYGVEQVWHLVLLAAAFCLGSILTTLRPIVLGLGAGVGVSSALAIAQTFGFDPIYQFSDPAKFFAPAGLFVNPNILAETAALVMAALLVERAYWLVGLCAPALLLGQSRTALVALATTFINKRNLWYVITAIACWILIYSFFIKDLSGLQGRVAIWTNVPFSLFGSGAGSFYQEHNDVLHAYNDPLEFISEFGIGAIPLFLAWAICLSAPSPGRSVLLAGGIIALFAFPLSLPVSGFLLSLVAGHATRFLSVDGDLRTRRRFDLHSRQANQGLVEAVPRFTNLSFQPNHP